MRTIKSGDQTMDIKASNLTYTIFYQEFSSNLSDELKHIEVAAQQQTATQSLESIDADTLFALAELGAADAADPQQAFEALSALQVADKPEILTGLLAMAKGEASKSLPIMSIMKVVWAMNASADLKKIIPAFDQWVSTYEDFDFVNTFPEIYAEIKRGFFRAEDNGQG